VPRHWAGQCRATYGSGQGSATPQRLRAGQCRSASTLIDIHGDCPALSRCVGGKREARGVKMERDERCSLTYQPSVIYSWSINVSLSLFLHHGMRGSILTSQRQRCCSGVAARGCVSFIRFTKRILLHHLGVKVSLLMFHDASKWWPHGRVCVRQEENENTSGRLATLRHHSENPPPPASVRSCPGTSNQGRSSLQVNTSLRRALPLSFFLFSFVSLRRRVSVQHLASCFVC